MIDAWLSDGPLPTLVGFWGVTPAVKFTRRVKRDERLVQDVWIKTKGNAIGKGIIMVERGQVCRSTGAVLSKRIATYRIYEDFHRNLPMHPQARGGEEELKIWCAHWIRWEPL